MGDPYRLHTPVQEVMKMQTGMKKVVLNHRGLLVVSDDGPAELCVEISPSEFLELVTTFSTANSKHVITRMMTCLLCVHIVHFTLNHATSQRKRQICKDA
jgi:hypothetical protein